MGRSNLATNTTKTELISLAELRENLAAKLRKSKIEIFPFPHLIIEEFFPVEVFDRVLAFNPFKNNEGMEWKSRGESSSLKMSTPYYARMQINFHQEQKFAAPPEEASFWKLLTDCFLGDHWFTQMVYEKFESYFQYRFGELALKGNFFDHFRKELFLQRHRPGYYIGPHTDIPSRVFTCIFSFADRPGFEEYGTELCVPKDPLVRCWGNDHYSPEGFEIRKIAPYKPNNFLLFLKTRQSFHSVKAINADCPNGRYGMQFQLYEPDAGIFRDLSEPDLIRMKFNKPPKQGFDRILAKLNRVFRK